MSEPNYPSVTPQDVKAASRDREKQVFLGIGFAIGASTAYQALNAPGGKPAQFVVKMLTGFKVTPSKPDVYGAKVQFPRPSVLLLLAPQPIGLVPAETYGLHPSVVARSLGFRTGNKPPVLNASAERVKVYEAQQVADAIVERAVGPVSQYTTYGPTRSLIPPGPVRLTRFELDYLRSLPTGVSSKSELFLAALDRGEVTIIPEPPIVPESIGPNFDLKPLGGADYGEGAFDIEGHLTILEDEAGKRSEAIEAAPGVYIPLDARGVAIVGGRNGK